VGTHHSLNAAEELVLAIAVFEAGFMPEPAYVYGFFKRELGFVETPAIIDFANLLSIQRPRHDHPFLAKCANTNSSGL
jgi:hypothetical protein